MFSKFLNITPEVHLMPDYDLKPETDWYGIKALWFEGGNYKGKKTRVFAHIGYPQDARSEKVPAVVLVHGGGGHAYAEWIKIWNDRGYAALALDLRGFLPACDKKGLVGKEEQRDDWFERWQDDDVYIAGPDGYCIYNENEAIEDVWLYQAVANTILAHNILIADEYIDSEKIGITGISWGGVTTSQVIAYDKRFAFAIPIYGSGFLHYSLAEIMQGFKMDEAKGYWDISEKYSNINFPVLWLCWNSDTCFDFIPNSLSFLATKSAGAVLSVCDKMNHAHWCGWVREESYRFADSVVGNAPKFIRFKAEPQEFFANEFHLEADVSDKNITATLFYIIKEYSYNQNSEPDFEWQTKNCEIKGDKVFLHIPAETKAYYIELKEKIGDKEYISTSVLKKK